MDSERQKKLPFLDALKKYVKEGVSPFDVPGHHMGNVDNEFKKYLGNIVYKADVNAPYGLDNLAHPQGVLLEAENLMADACNADSSFFLINGTTSGILAMIMSVCRANDKIILPRNVHKSVTNALILSGAVPIYIKPELDMQLEIANQPSIQDYKKAILKFPSAKAVFIINPTYFGAVLDLKEIVDFAHEHNMVVLVDEAHGAHYYFSDEGLTNAMEAGADLSAVSFHKTGGSLTQSSVLLLKGDRVSKNDIRKTLNILNSTSPSTLLLASLDSARHYMANYGKEAMKKVIELSNYAIKRLENIPGFIPRSKDYFILKGCYDYDITKLVIELDKIKLSGFEVYRMLKEKYHVQMELAETYVILGIIAIGTKKEDIDRLAEALKDISKKYHYENKTYPKHYFDMNYPVSIVRPRTSYHAPSKKVKIEDSLNEISKESVMIYPPGIPLIASGEIITKEIIESLIRYRNSEVTIISDYDDGTINVIDLNKWKKYSKYQKKINDYIENKKVYPRYDNYHMPFEGDDHQGTLMLLPYRKDTWRNGGIYARKAYKEVIKDIAKFEKVYLGIDNSIYNKVIDDFIGLKNVECYKVKYNDAWARDTMPLFVINDDKIRGVDFRFNAWGGKVDGLYSNYKNDDELSKKVLKYLQIDGYYEPSFILEGGSIHVDGQGTLITTEACLLSKGRNPSLSKYEIEEKLKTYLGVEKIIWIPNGIDEDETNEHVDNMLAFARPGVILLAWSEDKDSVQYKNCQKAYKILSKETDANGNKFKIIKVKLPKNIYMSKEEAKGIKSSSFDAKPRLEGEKLSASYVNFYQGKDFVIMPTFNVKEDEKAIKQFKEIFYDKEVIPVYSKEILLGGGNIHCITMQIPKGKRKGDN